MWNSGFFNALNKNGLYDRKYNAEAYSNALSMIVGSGVVNTLNGNSFKVTSTGTPNSASYALTINQGWAWLNGKWVHSDTNDSSSKVGDYTLNEIAMCAKNYKRIDRLFIRRDDSVEVRSIFPVIKKSDEVRATVTNIPEPIQEGVIYEICLAEIHLDYTGETPIVTVYDKRADKELCGWVNGYFGDNWEQYCATITEVVNNFVTGKTGEFNRWFEGVRNEVATVTLLKPIINSVTLSQSTSTVAVGIAEYEPSTDMLEVYTNGIYEREGTDYTLNTADKTITFKNPKTANTVIDFIVTKAIDGRFYNNPDTTLVASVESRLTAIIEDLSDRKETVESFTYFATGENDNIKLCDKVKSFLSADLSDSRMLRINIVSTDKDFTITQPCYSGDFSSLENYNRYFDFSLDDVSTRRFELDFSNCSPINIDIPNNSNNIIFYGSNQTIKNIVLKAGDNSDTGTKIVGVYGSNDIKFVNCKFGMTCSSSIEFAYHGIYEDCKITLTSNGGNATAFYPSDGNIVEVRGGIYFLFTTATAVSNGYETKFIYHSLKEATSTTALSICRDVSIPNYTRAGYVQDGKLYHCVGGYLRAANVITASARTNSISNTNNEITGAIALNRAKGQTPFV